MGSGSTCGRSIRLPTQPLSSLRDAILHTNLVHTDRHQLCDVHNVGGRAVLVPGSRFTTVLCHVASLSWGDSMPAGDGVFIGNKNIKAFEFPATGTQAWPEEGTDLF
ncbi:hypothetical protein CBL_07303 [Carabus blaptoides fortunei]